MTDAATIGESRFSPLPGTIIKAADLAILNNADDVRIEIETMRADALAECEDLRRTAREEGRREGLADAAIAGARIVAATTARMQATLDGLSEAFATATMDTAAQIIGESADPEVATKAVTAALSRAKRHMSFRIFVWPAAVDQVREAAERAMEHREDMVTLLSVDSDSRLEPGRIVLSSERGYVELGVGEQLDVAKQIVQHSYDEQIAVLDEQEDAVVSFDDSLAEEEPAA